MKISLGVSIITLSVRLTQNTLNIFIVHIKFVWCLQIEWFLVYVSWCEILILKLCQ